MVNCGIIFWGNTRSMHKISLSQKNVANFAGNKFKEFLQEMVLKIGDFTNPKLVYLFFNVICC
jgi:hypothetical protein